ncbi:Unannotated [Lentimonas sp. CC19]|nr:Unannotated [Lentimonas sp. CC10]CAA6697440.1 Unannotated [Lentimonas sp. CC19]CAA7072489.1 Unannotated [Lentimonas sp. CC11]
MNLVIQKSFPSRKTFEQKELCPICEEKLHARKVSRHGTTKENEEIEILDMEFYCKHCKTSFRMLDCGIGEEIDSLGNPKNEGANKSE